MWEAMSTWTTVWESWIILSCPNLPHHPFIKQCARHSVSEGPGRGLIATVQGHWISVWHSNERKMYGWGSRGEPAGAPCLTNILCTRWTDCSWIQKSPASTITFTAGLLPLPATRPEKVQEQQRSEMFLMKYAFSVCWVDIRKGNATLVN